MTPLLEVRGLTLTLPADGGAARILNGVDLDLKAGGRLGLIGESGSGKSMTALTLLGLQPEAAGIEGRIRYRGHDLLGLDEPRWRTLRGGEIAMIFQEPLTALNPVMPIGRQVAEGPIRHGAGRAEARERAAWALRRVGLPYERFSPGLYPHQLSGGQRQRVMIAICLAMRPNLLVADEPTTALDVTVQAEVLALLEQVTEQEGMGLLLITHDLGVVAAMTERTAVIYAGRVVEAGATAAVFAVQAHPYTRALVAALPDLKGAPPRPIPGSVPSPLALPPGCPFAPRCPRADARCRREDPPLASPVVGHEDHAVACFHPHEGCL